MALTVQHVDRADVVAAQEAPTDAMLDVFNDLRRRLESDPGPLNDRLKTIFDAFRIDTPDDEILIVPTLTDDVVAGHTGTVRLVSGEAATDHQDAALATAQEPTLLLVSPPGAARRVKAVDYAWAYRPLSVNFPELRIPAPLPYDRRTGPADNARTEPTGRRQ